jgi:hypothetical protein
MDDCKATKRINRQENKTQVYLVTYRCPDDEKYTAKKYTAKLSMGKEGELNVQFYLIENKK